MANRINYTDKVALNARTEIAEINKHTAANDNEIKNVVNAHATNIETLEANQTSGVIRADTIVDEGDGRSFLPVTGDTSTAYIVDGETAPDEAKNGNYEWDGAAYTKTAYQTVAGSKTDLATNGSQDVFTSQGAFDLDADLQGQIDSNDVEIAQNISDIAQNTLDITQNESDIADNQTRSTDTENILLVGSDAYTHAERGVSDGFTTERLVQLDNEIEANLDANFYFKAGHSKGAGKIGIAVPDVSAADLSLSRNANATFVNKRGVIETALPNVPRFDWSSGEPVLLTEPEAENFLLNSSEFSGWSQVNQGGVPTLTANAIQGVVKDLNAYKFESSGGLSRIARPETIPFASLINNTCAESIYVKADSTSTFLRINSFDTSSDQNARIDLSDFSVVSTGSDVSCEIKEFFNGWYRIIYTRTNLQGDTNMQVQNEGGSFFIDAFQLEAGDKATSYIPTDGATAVRLADTGIETGDISQYIDSTNFTLEIEFKSLASYSQDMRFTLSDDSTSNRLRVTKLTNETLSVAFDVNGTSSLVSFSNSNPPSEEFVLKIGAKSGDYFASIDGVDFGNSTQSSTFNALDIKYFKLSEINNTQNLFAEIKSIKIS